MKNRNLVLVSLLAIAVLALAACGGQAQQTVEVTRIVEVTRMVEAPAAPEETTPVVTGNTLEAVRSRGTLRCGGNQAVPGFGYINPDTNEFEGFDIDYCRAIAAAVLNDANAIEIRPTTATERFLCSRPARSTF